MRSSPFLACFRNGPFSVVSSSAIGAARAALGDHRGYAGSASPADGGGAGTADTIRCCFALQSN